MALAMGPRHDRLGDSMKRSEEVKQLKTGKTMEPTTKKGS